MRRLAALLIGTYLALGQVGSGFAAPAIRPVPAQSAQSTDLQTFQVLLSTPEAQLDLAQAKLIIDQLIDPAIEADAVRRELDALTKAVRNNTPAGANRRSQLDALLVTLYQPGSWNNNRPFRYDLDDPLGENRSNKLLATYLSTRKGNCVSMPILLAILGQRLGLFMTLATAPEHVLVKFVDDDGRWLNIEATSGGFKYDSSYERETGITPTAIKNEIYLRPLSPHETVGVMASTLMEHYASTKQDGALLAVAELALAANPKDTVAMIQKANAYYLQLQQRFSGRYPTPADIPTGEQADYIRLSRDNLAWFAKAEQLGWAPPTHTEDKNYLKSIEREKARRRK